MNTNSTIRAIRSRRAARGAMVVLVAASIVALGGCKDRRRREFGAGPRMPCEGEFSVEVVAGGYALRGAIRTQPGARVTLVDRRLGEAVSVADPNGVATITVQVSGRLPEFAMFQCGVIGDRSQPYGTGHAPLRTPPRLRQSDTVNLLSCEGRSCSVAFVGTNVRLSGESGARVTVGDRTVTLAGRQETIPFEAASALEGLAFGPSDSGGWNNFRRTRIQKPVTVRFADGVELRGSIAMSTYDVSYAYGELFVSAKDRAVLTSAPSADARGALLFTNNVLSNVFGPVERPSDVRFVGYLRRGVERRASCGRYRRGAQIVQVDRVMRDGLVEVFDPRTGQRVHGETIRAPEARCSNTMRSVADATSEFSLVEGDRAFARFLAQRMGGSIPATLAFEPATAVATPAQPSQVAGQNAGDAGAEGAASDAPTSRPDPSFAATLRAALGARYRVNDATADTDAYSKATERTASIDTDDDSLQVRFVDYSTVPAALQSRVRMRGSTVTMVPREAEESATEAEVRVLLGASATSVSGLRAALQRSGWTCSGDPDDNDEGDGVRTLSATATKGDHTMNVYVRTYAGVASGGDEPRAMAIRGQRVWIVSGGSTRAVADRVLRAIAR
ncbi:MAG: hypothetical protein JNK05_35475 [Myxococcales bacterium]|nr:hypothetical protein [Myxococcales bacterium]